jgi:hypothetical protein
MPKEAEFPIAIAEAAYVLTHRLRQQICSRRWFFNLFDNLSGLAQHLGWTFALSRNFLFS